MALPYGDITLDDPVPLDKINGNLKHLDTQNEALAKTSLQRFYVSKTGNDNTGDGTSSKPFLTIAKANSLLMSNKRPKEIIISGDYSDEQLTISNIDGLSVRVTGINSAKVKAIFFTYYVSSVLFFDNFEITGTTTSGGEEACVANGYNYNSLDSWVYLNNCVARGNDKIGILIRGKTKVFIDSCTFDNTSVAININSGYLISKNNTGIGTSYAALIANYGAYIKPIGTQPDGTHINVNGGIIK